MIASPILSDVAHAVRVAERAAKIAQRAARIASRAARLVAIEMELAELSAAGVKVVVTAAHVVALEEKGLIVNLETGEVVEPVVALDRVRGAR